jgi:GxxExxY protein
MSSVQSILIEGDLTGEILNAAYTVHNALGAGFLEKVYANALAVELRRKGLKVEQQKPMQIQYAGKVVGEYMADLVVASRVLVECKAATHLEAVHEAQVMNYLRATGLRVGLLINFGRPKVQFRRFVS